MKNAMFSVKLLFNFSQRKQKHGGWIWMRFSGSGRKRY